MGGAKFINTVPIVGKKTCFHYLLVVGRDTAATDKTEGKVLSTEIVFCIHMTRIETVSVMCHLFGQNQLRIASTGKQIVMVGRPELLSQSLPSFRYRLSVVYQKSLNVSEQNCNVYWSKV